MTNLHRDSRGTPRGRGAGLWAAFALLLAVVPLAAVAAPGDRSLDGVWTDLGDAQQKSLTATNRVLMPEAYHVFQLDEGALGQILAAAPDEKDVPAKDGVVLSFPMPDGTYARFTVVDSPILEPEAQALIPDMRTYLAQGLDDPTAVLRFDVGYWGFRAYGRTSQGTLWIDPWQLGDRTNYISAWKHDFPRDDDEFTCEFVEDAPLELGGDKAIPSSGSQLHRYRLIPTLTGEYSVFFGGAGPAQAAATTTINRINVVYETDAAVRFLIQAWLAYANPATDPFTTGGTVNVTLLNQNQAAVDAAFGSAAYDIGHILTRGGGGGLAFLGVACNNASKARGGTGSSNPQGDPFDIDYVAHEVGHQMGGNHTFNGTTGACSGNRVASTSLRARQRLDRHGLRRHLRCRERAVELRSLLPRGEPRGDHHLPQQHQLPGDLRHRQHPPRGQRRTGRHHPARHAVLRGRRRDRRQRRPGHLLLGGVRPRRRLAADRPLRAAVPLVQPERRQLPLLPGPRSGRRGHQRSLGNLSHGEPVADAARHRARQPRPAAAAWTTTRSRSPSPARPSRSCRPTAARRSPPASPST